MLKKNILINGIPAIVWGPECDRVFIAVHGDQSNKADATIQILAETAVQKGCQVLSFDLPEHGERQGEAVLCKVQECIADLSTIMDYVKERWSKISLFGCSLGAYFSLMAYSGEAVEQALFLSPVVDMKRLIENMMSWFAITPEMLKTQEEIDTPIGKRLYWDYYCYVKEHPVEGWKPDTRILYGEKDNLSELDVVRQFVEQFHSKLEIVPDGEHFFHTEEQLSCFRQWLTVNMEI